MNWVFRNELCIERLKSLALSSLFIHKVKFQSILVILLAVMLGGCYSFQGASIPPDVNTFLVGFIENKSAQVNPQLGQIITEKLKDKLNNTKLNIVQQNGDFNFNAVITGYNISPVTVQENAAATQNRLTITLNVIFECPKHPNLNFEQNFSSFQDFDGTKNFTSLEGNLVTLISDQLVQEIFNKAAVNW